MKTDLSEEYSIYSLFKVVFANLYCSVIVYASFL